MQLPEFSIRMHTAIQQREAKPIPQNRSDRKHSAQLALNVSAGQNRKHLQPSNLRPARRKKIAT